MLHPIRNQHYVPQFLLRNFNSGKESFTWVFDKDAYYKNWKPISEKSIKSVASETYFYDKEISNKNESLEFQLSQIENGVAPIVQKLVSSCDLNYLSKSEKDLLALFVSLQMLRTKESLADANRLQSQLLNGIKQFITLPDETGGARDLWIQQIHNAAYYAEFLLKKTWALFQSNKRFFTSDNPVVRSNYVNPSVVRGTLGINSDGIEIYLPLSDSLILSLFCERIHKEMVQGTDPLMPENIEYVNSLQVMQSNRFIFSATDDYKLVYDMLK